MILLVHGFLQMVLPKIVQLTNKDYVMILKKDGNDAILEFKEDRFDRQRVELLVHSYDLWYQMIDDGRQFRRAKERNGYIIEELVLIGCTKFEIQTKDELYKIIKG